MDLQSNNAANDTEAGIDSSAVDDVVSMRLNALAKAVAEAQHRITSCLDTSSVLRTAAREAQRLTTSEAVFISFSEGKQLLIREVWVKSGEMRLARPWVLSPEHSLAARAIRSGQTVKWARGYHQAQGMDEAAKMAMSPLWRSMAVPIVIRETPVGAITFAYEDESLFGSDMMLVAEMLAGAVATALENVESHQDSIRRAEHLSQERIAQQLHDSAVQSLCALRTKVSEILSQPGLTAEATSSLHGLESLISDINSELREAIFSPASGPELAEECIGDGLRAEVAQHVAAGGVPVQLVGDQVPLHLPDEVCAIVRLLVREGLSNVRKHSNATTVMVGLSVRQTLVTVYVRDDGVGLGGRPEQVTHGLHFGLANLERLIGELDGELSAFDNEDEPGMTLRARIQLGGGDHA